MVEEPLNPIEHEALKSQQERAEDAAYVINHALSCGTTDTFIQPFAGAFVQNRIESGRWPQKLAWLKHFFESGHHHGPAHHEHGAEHKPTFSGNLKHWFLGEAAGDFLAVPLTVWVQRHLPGFTGGIRKITEPFVGWYFHMGAHRDARKWAAQQGLSADSPETLEREAKIYDNELRHLPLAFVWNMFSIPINLITQKISGSEASWKTMLAGKTFGSIFSNTVLLSGRAIAPTAFEKWDEINSKHLIIPVSEAVGKILGTDDKPPQIPASPRIETGTASPADTLPQQQKDSRNWVERTQAGPAQDPTQQRAS